MKIKSLSVERFRQFKETKFEVSDINILVGPNNSGKTSILHALRAFFFLLKGYVNIEGNPPKATYHKRFISTVEELVPTPDTRELWYQRQASNTTPIKISVEFNDGAKFTLQLRYQFGQVHASIENLQSNLSSEEIKEYFDQEVVYIPGLVGVLVKESYATAARRNSLAAQGRYSEIFRSSLMQLKNRDTALLTNINVHLEKLFGITVSDVAFNETTDEFVTVKYRQSGKDYDVVSSGSGLQQVIQMLAYLYLSKPSVLLIDEPDAHLHSRLQGALGKLLREVAIDLKTQLFLSTHSVDLIDTFNPEEVIIVDASKKSVKPLGANRELVSSLVDAGIVDISAFSRLLAS
ncbi:MAG: AAA family ATPase [Meiothermus sp.]|nr:AAA family ATPase [Meiothermus sp.]